MDQPHGLTASRLGVIHEDAEFGLQVVTTLIVFVIIDRRLVAHPAPTGAALAMGGPAACDRPGRSQRRAVCDFMGSRRLRWFGRNESCTWAPPVDPRSASMDEVREALATLAKSSDAP